MTPDADPASAPPQRDDGLDWLREIRRQLAAEAGDDVFEMGRRLREREKKLQGRLFRTERVLVPVEGGPAGSAARMEDAESSCVVREEPPSL